MASLVSWLSHRGRAVSLAAALVVLAGCETMAVSALNGAASEIANRDCALERLFTQDPICLERTDPTLPPVVPTVFCYRNIGGVSCYPEPGEMEDAVRRDVEERMPLGS